MIRAVTLSSWCGSPKQVFDGHVKACYTLDINAKTGGKAVGRREYDDTKYRLCASLKGKQMERVFPLS